MATMTVEGLPVVQETEVTGVIAPPNDAWSSRPAASKCIVRERRAGVRSTSVRASVSYTDR